MSLIRGKFAVTCAILLVACSDATSITEPTDLATSLGRMANGFRGATYTLVEGQLPAGERSVSATIGPRGGTLVLEGPVLNGERTLHELIVPPTAVQGPYLFVMTLGSDTHIEVELQAFKLQYDDDDDDRSRTGRSEKGDDDRSRKDRSEKGDDDRSRKDRSEKGDDDRSRKDRSEKGGDDGPEVPAGARIVGSGHQGFRTPVFLRLSYAFSTTEIEDPDDLTIVHLAGNGVHKAVPSSVGTKDQWVGGEIGIHHLSRYAVAINGGGGRNR